ncbi:SRPBCC family protein [Streptomyces fimicarius]|uniref:SRPBCC family protein n=1 Tax=Streptomyces caviscabies TaxID=90079 RepID=A0ABW2MMH3_9ACTN|nr:MULTISPECIES: SRPBCC family protein [Streptomyces]MDX3340467.1 SRPBCC family protein [Streptomyces sp. ME02-6979.5a]MDX3503767.1 SRPBCC family protein [Streptomyces sp. ATCC51928]MDX3594763.1 SRPBCC family protein [Streptomyces sp. ID03-2B]MDX5525735.1 SRPBCC family protein [Streptomyces sp. DE06-01C]QXQ94959.1 SRPBCC family protein [Streptomyces sp. WY228]
MSTRFEATVDIDRPIEEVFAYLADGEHDPEFSPRVQRIEKSPNGPTRVGTVFHSTVKDAGMTSRRDFEISELVAPTRIRWHEQSKNLITAAEGGYDLERTPDGGTHVRLFNVLEGHGVGKLLVGFAGSAARKDAPAFGQRIKEAVEAP